MTNHLLCQAKEKCIVFSDKTDTHNSPNPDTYGDNTTTARDDNKNLVMQRRISVNYIPKSLNKNVFES